MQRKLMPRSKSVSPKIIELQERAETVGQETVRQAVPLDMQTFDKIVQFIEAEGCDLSEGLRRAVRLGVEALLLERFPEPEPRASRSRHVESGAVTYHLQTPHLAGYNPGDLTALELSIDAANALGEDDDEDSIDYKRVAPPGL
jgi:hypothetical protein